MFCRTIRSSSSQTTMSWVRSSMSCLPRAKTWCPMPKSCKSRVRVTCSSPWQGEGAVLVTEDGDVIESPSPKGTVVNSVGAGRFDGRRLRRRLPGERRLLRAGVPHGCVAPGLPVRFLWGSPRAIRWRSSSPASVSARRQIRRVGAMNSISMTVCNPSCWAVGPACAGERGKP